MVVIHVVKKVQEQNQEISFWITNQQMPWFQMVGRKPFIRSVSFVVLVKGE